MKQIKMKDAILSEGLDALRRNDSDIDTLLTPRLKEVKEKLERYIAEIELFNPAYGLVGAVDRRELIVKHILDSLAPLGIIRRLLADKPLHIADVGSGAGLPGIPLAIALPQVNCTLIERMGRRAGFLRNTQAALGLGNAAVEEAEMEKAAPGRFTLVTFRAFRPLEPKLVKGLFRLCGEGGLLAAYKGRRAKIEEEMAALEQCVPGFPAADSPRWEAIPCPVPMLDEERHLLVVRPGSFRAA